MRRFGLRARFSSSSSSSESRSLGGREEWTEAVERVEAQRWSGRDGVLHVSVSWTRSGCR